MSETNGHMNNFTFDYARTVADAIGTDLKSNYDVDRFGPSVLERKPWRKKINRALAIAGLASAASSKAGLDHAERTISSGLEFIQPHLNHLEWLYGKVNDAESRKWLVDLMAFRALGHKKIRLPTNTPEYWRGIAKAKSLDRNNEGIDLGFLGFHASKIDLSALGYPINLFFVPFAAHIQFTMEPYRLVIGEKTVAARQGDVVLDCGGCYGDTALYFSHKVGKTGKVLSFEFVPNTLALWHKNMELNPELKETIRLIEAPVSDASGKELFVEGFGPGARVVVNTNSPHAKVVTTVAIDDIVVRENLPTVDFIKMDIEGSELSALRGAKETLQRFRPVLAVSVYHSLDDFWTIPQYLDGLKLGYRFYLRHFTIHAEESVLFAVPAS